MGAREGACPHIRIGISKRWINALVDSVSCRTLMNVSTYESFNLPSPTRSTPDLVTVTGTTVPTAGVVDICLDTGLVLNNVVLTSGMGVPVLIGTDVLEANGGVLDYSQICYSVYVTNWGVCQGPISHNNEQTQTVEGII